MVNVLWEVDRGGAGFCVDVGERIFGDIFGNVGDVDADFGQQREEGFFAFTALFAGARSKTSYRISLEEIRVIGGNAFGGGEILKNSSIEEKLRRLASDITASTLFELRISGYLKLAAEVAKLRRNQGS